MLLGLTAPLAAEPSLDPIWSDGIVLQRGQPVLVGGRASSGETIYAKLGNESAVAKANSGGRFELNFGAQKTGASLQLRVAGADGASAEVADIAIGDVYLCSGQSNMELPVRQALDSLNQLRMASNDGIRLLQIPHGSAPLPHQRFANKVRWHHASPASVQEFSAACYYMGQKLRRDRGVPIGLIDASWGGSAASAWLSQEGGRRFYGQESLDALALYDRDPLAAARAFVPHWYDWWRTNNDMREPWADPSMLDWKPIPKFSFWNEWTGTGLDQAPAANVWLTQSFQLTAEQARKGGTLSIGAIDDLDLTWLNGEPVGYTFG